MLWYVPHIYPNFQCKASLCRHNCCIGWEIDVDDATRGKYAVVEGDFGKRLSNNMITQDGITSFCLTEGDRCPFLNGENLCDIHLTLGEDHLCQICSDHPRFRNYFSMFGEIGLGLSCEEAARLVLTEKAPMKLIPLYDDGEVASTSDEWETWLVTKRNQYIKVAQNRDVPLVGREAELLLLAQYDMADFDWSKWVEQLLLLERMDPAWDTLLLNCKGVLDMPLVKEEVPYEQFLVYLLFRHLADATDEEDLKSRLAFCVFSSKLLRVIACANPQVDFVECARMFSAEIEYSPDNTEALLCMFDPLPMEDA